MLILWVYIIYYNHIPIFGGHHENLNMHVNNVEVDGLKRKFFYQAYIIIPQINKHNT